MGIYRGPGGVGDATQDAASEVLLAVQAKNDALAAQAAAELARDAAQLAETNAETAETNAETAETNAETAATNAAASASAASTSASNAATSATNAANSATAAQTAETNAETAETNAAASASAASTSASNAATSATNAANSASSASTSATNASNSASAAATSATNAAASATSASNSASTATTQATNAANSATAAATSASNAASSATSASNSASTATTQATNAANSASAAATSATNAANSASAAATSATNAANSATSAASSATSAAASLDSFDDRYLGAKSSAPTLDNDGNALLNGALYFDSTLAAMRVYNTATATWATIQQGVTDTDPVRHSVRPSLLLDFANTKTLDPRITFTRASTGTFYDGKTVAKAEENLLLGSETFDSAAWSKVLTTVTANSTIAPDGNTTAETLTGSAGSAYIVQALATTSGLSYTFSVFAKANTTNFLQLAGGGSVFGTNVWANFDLSAGTVGSVGSLTTASIQSVGSGWYRCVMTGTATASASANAFGIVLVESGSATRFPTNAGATSIYAWGAQLEQRSSVTAYTPTTTAPITNYIPALQTAASGVARFEHNPVTGESLGLEIEEQRTNLLSYSEQFDNAAWGKTRASIDSNTIVAPDGTLTGDKLVASTDASTTHFIQNNATTTATSHTFTVYVKPAGYNFVYLFNATASLGAYFDLVNTTIGTVSSGVTASITDVGNGWRRCSMTATATAATNGFRIYPAISTSSGSFTGDGYSGIYIWGAQLEAGSFATSYIKTEGSQVTRNADSASMTGTNFSSWYRADEGTVYAEALTQSATSTAGQVATFVSFNDGTVNNRIRLTTASVNGGIFSGAVNNTTQFGLGTAPSLNVFGKYAGAYKVNDFAFSQNGGSSSTSSSGLLPVVNQMQIGNLLTTRELTGTIKKLAYYAKRLTNAELQGLTTV